MEALAETTSLLQMNGEFNAVWNYRRDIIAALREQLDGGFWEAELKLTMAHLRESPKVYWIWNHRQWCLQHHAEQGAAVWKRELALVGKMLELDPRNFHGWHYRRVVVRELERRSGASLDSAELSFTTEKINENISNFSAWYQRAQLIPRMIASGKIADTSRFAEEEASYIINAMYTDAEDQSVWMYLKWFAEASCIRDDMPLQDYDCMLTKFRENIMAINQDELEFSGRENIWCLKMLVFLGSIAPTQQESPAQRRHHLERLIELDSMRRNRYIHMLENA